MTDDELTQLQVLADKATAGPWEFGGYKSPDLKIVWSETKKDDVAWLPAIRGQSDNGRFIAAARSAVPALVAEVRRLGTALDECGAFVDDWHALSRNTRDLLIERAQTCAAIPKGNE